MNAEAKTVFIVDDDESFLPAARRLLRALGYAVEAFSSADAFLAKITHRQRGCLIVDLDMPGKTGLEVQDILRRRGVRLPVIFLTGQGDIPASVRAMRGGAEDFLTKSVPKEILKEAVDRALAREELEFAARQRADDVKARLALLSPRETEVLQAVVSGKLNKQIADQLQISERTVKLHRTNLTRRLGLHSVAELTRLAHEAGLV